MVGTLVIFFIARAAVGVCKVAVTIRNTTPRTKRVIWGKFILHTICGAMTLYTYSFATLGVRALEGVFCQQVQGKYLLAADLTVVRRCRRVCGRCRPMSECGTNPGPSQSPSIAFRTLTFGMSYRLGNNRNAGRASTGACSLPRSC